VLAALSGANVRLPGGAKSDATKKLNAGAKAVGELGLGRFSSAVAAARAVHDPVFENAVRTTAELLRGGYRLHIVVINYLESADVAAHPALGHAIIEQAEGEDLLQLKGEQLESRIPKRVWSHLIQAQLRHAADEPLRLSTLLRPIQPQHVAEGWLGNHWLWRGYQELRRRPKVALDALADAIRANGGNLETILLEALRGGYLVALDQLARQGPSLSSADQIVRSSERLFGLLVERDAQLEAAILAQHTACTLLGEVRAFCKTLLVQHWVDRARTLLQHLGADATRASDELSCAEALAALASTPERTLSFVKPILERDARHVDAWRLRLAAARRLKDPRIDDWSVEAHRTTGDPSFERQSERVLFERGELAPFERLRDHPQLTPGKVVLESLLYLLAEPDHEGPERWSCAWRLSRPLASQLDGTRSSAVDAGLFAFGVTRYGIEACTELLCASLVDHAMVHEASLVVGALLHSEQFLDQPSTKLVETCARALLRLPRGAEALPVFMAALAYLDEGDLARRLLLRTAAELPNTVLQRCQESCELPPGFVDAFDLLHDHLHPELCGYQLLDPEVDVRYLVNDRGHDLEADNAFGNDDDADELRELDAAIEQLGWLTKLFKIDPAKVRALELERKAAFLESLDAIGLPQTPGALAAVRKLVERFGVAKDAIVLPRSFKPSSSTEKNKRKQQRKQQRKQGK
jgi:hypothetical protein